MTGRSGGQLSSVHGVVGHLSGPHLVAEQYTDTKPVSTAFCHASVPACLPRLPHPVGEYRLTSTGTHSACCGTGAHLAARDPPTASRLAPCCSVATPPRGPKRVSPAQCHEAGGMAGRRRKRGAGHETDQQTEFGSRGSRHREPGTVRVVGKRASGDAHARSVADADAARVVAEHALQELAARRTRQRRCAAATRAAPLNHTSHNLRARSRAQGPLAVAAAQHPTLWRKP